MKKTFLNLRKMGFVLVAAGSMLAFSCGGGEEETTDNEGTDTEATTETETETEETCDEACDATTCDGTEDSTATCDGAEACDGAESCDEACEGAEH